MICLCVSGSVVLPELLCVILHFYLLPVLMVPFILPLFQTIATVCVFLASKVEDTPCPLDLVVRVGYETMYIRDPITAQRIRQKVPLNHSWNFWHIVYPFSAWPSSIEQDVFEKQKALILIGERLVLTTIRFDFNIQHPYRPLHDAMKNLGIIQKEVKQVAWNFVNDWYAIYYFNL